ncbi:MAG TPA: Smr/MutS family protein [Xanthobacteraceae bacterium]
MKSDADNGRRRKLADEDRVLWDRLTRSVKPLRPRIAPPTTRPSPPVSLSVRPVLPTEIRPAAPLAPVGALDRRQKKRLARGMAALDARLDLHGKTQGQAHALLLRFLRGAQRDGARFVLVITGKGAPRDHFFAERAGATGVLRRQVPLWLKLPEFRAYVSACEPADTAHGGEGALYIRIRRQRHSRS